MSPFIFFDATGTLFQLTESVGSGYARISSAFGFQLDPSATDAAFRSAFATVEQPSYPDGPDESADHQWWKAFVAQVFAAAGEDPDRPSFSACFDALFSFYGTAEAWKLFPDTLPALEKLKQHGFELGILSNFDQRLTGILQTLGPHQHFQHIVISSEIGATKPHPDAFLAAAARAGRNPADCILIGDDPIRDQRGAMTAGFQAAHLVNRPHNSLETISNTLIQSLSS